ncbi:MAG: helix-turn-helix transcriptional regulator [Pirellulales bacterium]
MRRAIDAAPMSRYAICKAIGLNEATMSRFMAGEAGLSMKVLDRLADFLNLRITTDELRDVPSHSPAKRGQARIGSKSRLANRHKGRRKGT